MNKTYNLFSSHSWSYSGDYYRLKNLLDKRPYFYYADYSIPIDDPVHTASDYELNKAIYNRMQYCHIIIITAGVYSTYSEWITKEIRIATEGFQNPKPILAIKPWGNVNISSVATENADCIVSWNTESIVRAIRDIAL